MESLRCDVCPRQCALGPGAVGACGARKNTGAAIECLNYGVITSLALDPIEKKPLARYRPGTWILSAGSFGCNFCCPFCQNYGISTARLEDCEDAPRMTPADLVARAEALVPRGNIGLAFTYNEPLIGYEFLRDAGGLAKERGLNTVAVTNGCATPQRFAELLPFFDAMNIDLKAFSPAFYARIGGSLETVKTNIAAAAGKCHLELTCLIIPGENDSDQEMEAICGFIASISPEIPLHITRFLPRYRYAGRTPTPLETLRRLKALADKKLRHVFVGNVIHDGRVC